MTMERLKILLVLKMMANSKKNIYESIPIENDEHLCLDGGLVIHKLY